MVILIHRYSHRIFLNRALLGSQMAIFAFILAQFVEIDLGTVAGITLSLQKVVALFAYPLALYWMRSARVNIVLLFFCALLGLSFLMPLLFIEKTTDMLAASMLIITGFLGAFVLYNAVSYDLKAGMRFFATWWIRFSLLSSLIAALQMPGWVPLINVPEDMQNMRDVSTGFVRGVGFKQDPNFLALMLALTVTFIFYYQKGFRQQIIYFFIIVCGVFATFSRMGLLLIGLQVVLIVLFNLRKKLGVRIALFFVFLLPLLSFGVLLLPREVQAYINERATGTLSFFVVLFSDKPPSGWVSSAEQRAILLRSAFQAAQNAWPLGVGALQTASAIQKYAGFNNVSHNTFVELFLIGGFWGILTTLLYIGVPFYKSFSLARNKTIEFQTIRTLVFTILLAGIFLSLVYNSLFWLPLVLPLSISSYSRVKSQTNSQTV